MPHVKPEKILYIHMLQYAENKQTNKTPLPTHTALPQKHLFLLSLKVENIAKWLSLSAYSLFCVDFETSQNIFNSVFFVVVVYAVFMDIKASLSLFAGGIYQHSLRSDHIQSQSQMPSTIRLVSILYRQEVALVSNPKKLHTSLRRCQSEVTDHQLVLSLWSLTAGLGESNVNIVIRSFNPELSRCCLLPRVDL